jgi:D-alanyl-D-alanine carboxypeptidase
VQIAATNSEQDAQRMLTQARESVGRPLAGARLVTERVQRGNATLFRARFAGFADRGAAEAACAALKRGEYDCMAIRL